MTLSKRLAPGFCKSFSGCKPSYNMSREALLSKSIPELSQLFIERSRPVPKGLLEALDVDPRHGAQQLAKRIRGRYRSNRAEGQRLHFLLRFEIELWSEGFGLVAGVDEAGIAPLARAVVAGGVFLSPKQTTPAPDSSTKKPPPRHNNYSLR